MHDVNASEDLPMSADAVWRVVGDFSGIRKWATVVEAESTEVTPQGQVRTLTMPGGRTVKELLTDEGPHHYTYTLDRPDMDAYFSTVSVKSTGPDSSILELRVKFTPKDPDKLAEATEALTKFCRGNIKAMKRALGLV
ncbi:SRPBCC family protein [Phenylobacterium sp.]|uniref:SRPBCC family protein n=1 Tax=Phenylobacterium sp. TaxID=1871053 RepID=UPI003BAC5D1C